MASPPYPSRGAWQEIGDAEYRAERERLEAMLVELPLAAESNLVAFDRAAALYEEIGAMLGDTTREHQRQIVLVIVERVQATEGGVGEIRVRPEARPFFADHVAGDTAAADEEAPQRAAVGYWRPQVRHGACHRRIVATRLRIVTPEVTGSSAIGHPTTPRQGRRVRARREVRRCAGKRGGWPS